MLLELDKYIEYNETLENLKEKNTYNIFNKKVTDNLLDIIDLYYNQIGEDIKNITRLNKKIELFIDLININLAEKRNKFAKNTLNLEIVSFSYSISLFSTYLLGTNLKNHLETNDYAFLIIVIITIIINIPIYFILRCLFR